MNVYPTNTSAAHLVALFSNGKTTPDQVKLSIDALTDSAVAGNDDAIELLVNLASGLSDPTVSKEASDALVTLYRSADVHAPVRAGIEQQCLALFALLESSQEAVLAKGTGKLTVSDLPSALLCIAERAERKQMPEGSAREEKIKQALVLSIHAKSDVLEDVVAPSDLRETKSNRGAGSVAAAHTQPRCVSQTELFLEVQKIGGLRTNLTALNIPRDKAEGLINREFDDILSTPLKQLHEVGAPEAVLVNTGGHWVALVLSRSEAGNIDCLVFDSMGSEESRANDTLKNLLTQCFGINMGAFHYQGVDLQKHSTPEASHGNACGPFVAMALRHMGDDLVKSKPSAKSEAATPSAVDAVVQHAALKASLRTFVEKWSGLTYERQADLVCAERAAMLNGIEHMIVS